ncbi:hypothetical protein SNEBB_000642 [Seison nebaliae]|nr:hypothetical protein SNEBB_000642 [Seison nebaliae]
MSGFDDAGLFFSDNVQAAAEAILTNDENVSDVGNRVKIKNSFRKFLRSYHEGDFRYVYRDALLKHYNLQRYWLEVEFDDLQRFNENLADKIRELPNEILPLFEEAAAEIGDEITRPRPENHQDPVHGIQIMIMSKELSLSIRHLKSEFVSRLVKVHGIVISASNIRSKATKLSIQCRGCNTVKRDITISSGFDGYTLPRKCDSEKFGNQMKCPIDPYFILPDKCECRDYQLVKLQETHDSIKPGDIPRHIQLYCERYLSDRIVPGQRVNIIGIYSLKRIKSSRAKSAQDKNNVGVSQPYIRAISIEYDSNSIKSGKSAAGINVDVDRSAAVFGRFTPADEIEFKKLASLKNCYDIISNSIAPSIYGAKDIKKVLATMLFGGSRKRLPDGLYRRGDINVLLLGDPGTAKSQLLKFCEQAAPIAVYTSGKGSSAAGITASVNRDPVTRGFFLEGGAMVLADGGLVCIDEFDKMKEDDRVAIHEAMEQQTISIAKAGITTTLNSRCSVLAAANSIFGRWDDMKGEENIDFMPTILSRFDSIFIVKDEHEENKDLKLAKHVLKVHVNAWKTAVSTTTHNPNELCNRGNFNHENINEIEDESSSQSVETINENTKELSMNFLKKYIAYCRMKCGPRLNDSASKIIKEKYVEMRQSTLQNGSNKQLQIPITIRQLEAIIRMSEAIAKMKLAAFASEQDIQEALRLFKVSTLAAASSGHLSGGEGFVSNMDQSEMHNIELQIKRRIMIGSQVSQTTILQDFIRQGFSEQSIMRVIYILIRRGEFHYLSQRRLIVRLK